jgi:hypothetical protein
MGRSAAQTERRQYECKTQSACENGHPRYRQVHWKYTLQRSRTPVIL